MTVTYLPQAADDSDLGNTLGTTVNVPVLTNDTGSFVASSVRIVGPGGPVVELIVAGEGRWLANSDGTVTFFPEAGYKLDPAPIDYRVTDVTGDSVDAQVTHHLRADRRPRRQERQRDRLADRRERADERHG